MPRSSVPVAVTDTAKAVLPTGTPAGPMTAAFVQRSVRESASTVRFHSCSRRGRPSWARAPVHLSAGRSGTLV